MMTISSPASAMMMRLKKVMMRLKKVMMRVLTHGMVTNVATQSRPAMMRRVRERFGRVEKGWMIVRYLKFVVEKGWMIVRYLKFFGGFNLSTFNFKFYRSYEKI